MRQFARLTHCLVVMLVAATSSETARAGKLDRAGSNARDGSSSGSSSSHGASSPSEPSRSSGTWFSSGDFGGDDTDPAVALAIAAYGIYYAVLGVTSPWWLPNILLEANHQAGTARAIRFADYPYASGTRGFLLEAPELITEPDGSVRVEENDAAIPKRVEWAAARFGVEYGIGVTDGISRFGVHARLQLPLRVQFDTDWSLWREHDREGIDVAFMGREHLAIRFAESSRVQFYSGLGPQHFCDGRSCIHGVDFTWGFEAFPSRPFVFGFEGALGNLDQAFAPGLRTHLGYLIGPVEASVGWHQRWVGNVPLGGPFIGVSGWF
jgi:hypothetical protein